MIEQIEAEAAKQAAAKEKVAATKMNRIVSYQKLKKPFWALCGDVCKDSETKTMVIVRSLFCSSFWAAFHFRTHVPTPTGNTPEMKQGLIIWINKVLLRETNGLIRPLVWPYFFRGNS